MKALIVGCGLSGLATALGLVEKDKRIHVVIVERRTDFASRGATFGLAPNGQVALQEIAPTVLEKLKSVGIFLPSSGGYMLPWWKVRDALLERAQMMTDQITLHLGTSIDQVKENTQEGSLTATFQNSDLTIHADVLIGADGVHSYIRREVLKLPPASPTDTYVWRGSVNTSATEGLKRFQEYPLGKILQFGDTILLSLFNFHPKIEGTMAWVVSCRNTSKSIQIQSGTTTPLDLIQSYMDSVESPDDDLLQKLTDAKLVFENTHQPSELTWSNEMAVVDLTHESGWGGRGAITLVGDAAHSIRPASGLGGSLAFEDAVLVSRAIASECSGCARYEDMVSRLRAFEAQRLPRCQSLSRDQTLRSTLAYKFGPEAIPQWDPDYRRWVYEGPDAPPKPPVDETKVFTSFMEE